MFFILRRCITFAANALKSKSSAARKHESGMTLVEIMIVLAIIGMVMGLGGYVGIKKLRDAQKKDTKIAMGQIKNAMLIWQTSSDKNCPTTLGEITENGKEPKDGFGRPFSFRCPGEHGEIDIMSMGNDGKEGTEDDLKSWQD